jgi:hypothetical protein
MARRGRSGQRAVKIFRISDKADTYIRIELGNRMDAC